MRENFKFKDSDGIELNVYKWIPKGEKIGVVQISHGMTENVLRYDEFAEYLNDKGFIVYGHDHRGHGLTARTKEDLGYISDNEGFDWLNKRIKGYQFIYLDIAWDHLLVKDL